MYVQTRMYVPHPLNLCACDAVQRIHLKFKIRWDTIQLNSEFNA